MATEYPPLNKIYVFGYSANDRDFPILSATADPRVAGYQVPKDLSACPDKRYPNHVFTGAQPISGDQRVRHVWEILPSPWVPFTRYDDDLGPVQGRRRSVENTGQQASLAPDTKISYEGREGSAIVSTELEETWSIKTDEDGNSLFPIKDRDFYDASRGPVQERRQLFTPTGEEEGSLENVNGVITQTSYEPYNEFLSVKVVQTYKVDGPQLIGRATDNDGQLITVTTQRKGADSYIPPSPTATRTVEVSREDAESLVERVVDTPEIFSAKTLAKETSDPVPMKFRVAVPTTTSEENVEGQAQEPTLVAGEISKSEQQVNKFVKRVRSTFRSILGLPKLLTQKSTNNEGQLVTVRETLQLGDTVEAPSATKTVESEALGDGTYVVRTSETPEIFSANVFSSERPDPLPQKFRVLLPAETTQFDSEGQASLPSLSYGDLSASEQQVTKFVKRVSKTTRDGNSSSNLLGQVYTSELGGGVAEVIESYGNDQDINPITGVVSIEKENLGNDKFYTRQVKLSELAELKGQNYDETLDVSLPFSRKFVSAEEQLPDGPTSINPRDTLHSEAIEIDYETSRNKLLSVEYTTPVIEQISLPDTLVSATLYVYYTIDSSQSDQKGSTWSLNVGGAINTAAQLFFETKDGFSGPVEALNHLFFLKKEECSINEILSRVNAQAWPIIRPQNEKIILTTKSDSISSTLSSSLPNNFTNSFSRNRTRDIATFTIPPSLHQSIEINTIEKGNPDFTFTGQVSVPPSGSILVYEYEVAGETTILQGNIGATSPPLFPIGRFLYRLSTSPFKYGLVRVDATTVEIESQMV
jgi:hypothetical protein